jgi:type VI secretion system protein ImpH
MAAQGGSAPNHLEPGVATTNADAPAAPVTPAAGARPGAGPATSAGAEGAVDRPLAQLLDLIERAPQEFDFFQALRRLEAVFCDRPERPRFGTAQRPADEPIRLGQDPELAFAPGPLGGLKPGSEGQPPRLSVNFFGLFGPNGPLPLHLTEYARDRMRNADDPTMVRFFDVFHHRMLMLFYRVWASGRPAVNHDRPDTDRFQLYVGALEGLGLAALRGRDGFPDPAKLFYAGRLGSQVRNAEGLAAMIGDFFRLPARIESFVGDWLELPVENRWRLTGRAPGMQLGMSTTLGAHTWARQQKFRVVLGPLERDQFRSMLPGGSNLPKLTALVRGYVGEELRWDARLVLRERVEEPWRLGQCRLSWTTWLGRSADGGFEDLVLDPQEEAHQAAA